MAETVTYGFDPKESADDRASSYQVILFLAVTGLLCLVLPVALVLNVPDEGRSQGWIWAMAIIVWSGFRLGLIIANGRPKFFSFFFWLFSYVFMGIAPAVAMRSNQPAPTTPDVMPSLDATTLGVVIVGIVAFEIGGLVSYLTESPPVIPARGMPEPPPLAINSGVAAVMLTFGTLIGIYYVAKVGLGELLTSRDAAGVARAAAWPDLPIRAAVNSLAIFPTVVGIGALVQVRRTSTSASVRRLCGLAVVVGLICILVVVNPISTPRYTMGTVLFALVIFFGMAKTVIRSRLAMLAVLLGLFFIFPLGDAFRRTDAVDTARVGFFAEYARNADYDSIWQVANAYEFWVTGLATLGRQALVIPLFWIPRSIWPTKPLDTGVVLGLQNNYSSTNLSAPLWAEAMVNGGLVAVALTFLVLGWGVRSLDHSAVSRVSRGGLWTLIGGLLPAYLLILLRGSLLQAVGAAAIITLCLALLRLTARPAPLDPVDQAVSSRGS